MERHVGIDISLELSSLCVLDAAGKVIRRAKVASEPEALVAFLRSLGVRLLSDPNNGRPNLESFV